MRNDFSNIAKLISDGWNENDLSLPIIENGKKETITRKQFLQYAASRQVQLRDKIAPGDKVLIASGRGSFFFIDMFVIWALGAIAVPYAYDSTEKYINFLHSITEAKLQLDKQYSPDSSEDSPHLKSTLTFYNSCHKSTCSIFFTSGSTGTPKGVVLSHFSLANNSLGILDFLTINKERIFVNIPFHFTSCICHFLSCCFSNSTFIGYEEKLMFKQLATVLLASDATGFGGAPIQLRWVGEYIQSINPPNINNLNIKFLISSGDYLSVEIIKLLLEVLPKVELFTVYGLTELGGRFCVLHPSELNQKFGSVGKPIKGLNVKVVNPDNGFSLPHNEEGEIIASGQLLSSGYYKNQPATTTSFSEDGFFKTGDMGFLDCDGYLYINGRSDDVFKVNGKKVSALLITQALLDTCFFDDVAVISAEINIFGVVPIAFCTLSKGTKFKKGHTLKALRHGGLPPNHMPHEFFIIDQIPRTGSGKVRRGALKKMI